MRTSSSSPLHVFMWNPFHSKQRRNIFCPNLKQTATDRFEDWEWRLHSENRFVWNTHDGKGYICIDVIPIVILALKMTIVTEYCFENDNFHILVLWKWQFSQSSALKMAIVTEYYCVKCLKLLWWVAGHRVHSRQLPIALIPFLFQANFSSFLSRVLLCLLNLYLC